MKFKMLLLLLLFSKVGFTQEVAIKSIHNSREICITINSLSDSTAVFVGCFWYVKYVCGGNVVSIDLDRVKKESGDSIVELNFTSMENNKSNLFYFLRKGDDLKIRLIKIKGLKISKEKNLKIYLTINNEKIEVVSKRYDYKFCHKRGGYFSRNINLAGNIFPEWER